MIKIPQGRGADLFMGPFYDRNGDLAESLPPDLLILILGNDLNRPAPIQRPLASGRPPIPVEGEPGYFWVELLPDDTQGLQGLAVIWCPVYDTQIDIWIILTNEAGYLLSTGRPPTEARPPAGVDRKGDDPAGGLYVDIPTPAQAGRFMSDMGKWYANKAKQAWRGRGRRGGENDRG